MIPENTEELLEIIKDPLEILERAGINVDVANTVSGITDRIPTDTSGVFPWLEELWGQARGIVSEGDVLGGLWELVKELLNVAVELLGALVDLLRSILT